MNERTPLHLQGRPGDVAPVVLLPGDPGRAERIAARLEQRRQYTAVRGLPGFTGEYGGRPVSVQATGMGAPSAAIVAEELLILRARALVRVGTCGGTSDATPPGSLVIVTAAVPLDGTTRQYLGGDPFAPTASLDVVEALRRAAAAHRAPYRAGLVCTEDALYAEEHEHAARWAARGVLALEMECSAIFTVAALRGARAGAVLLVTNRAAEHARLEGEAMERGTDLLLSVALTAARALAGGER